MTSFHGFAFIIFSFLLVYFGNRIFQEEQPEKHAAYTRVYYEDVLESYKAVWEPYSQLPQPKITDIELRIDLFPEENTFSANGSYTLVNQSGKPIEKVLIRTGFDETSTIVLDGQQDPYLQDTAFKTYLYQLESTLLPGDSLHLHFQIESNPNTLFTRNSNILGNGTFLKQDILPRIGYPFYEDELALDDSLAHAYNYFHRDADYVKLFCRISTSADQIAIAPGHLLDQRSEGDRQVFTYSTPHPVKMNFSFHSALFEVWETEHQGIQIQVYHAPGHQQNTGQMMEGIMAALDHHAAIFGAYPYDQIRIVEFPHTEGGYSATLTANNIPASEVLFNINSNKMEGRINLPFYVMAHELTHEWFGNQLMPADAEGARMLTESIVEYLTLCIYEEQFGLEMAAQFLEVQHQRYQEGKRRESEEERPLYRALAHQEYLTYGKGAIALNEIAEMLGKTEFNHLLKEFLLAYRLDASYYVTTTDFLDFLQEKTTPEEFALIEQWLVGTGLPDRESR